MSRKIVIALAGAALGFGLVLTSAQAAPAVPAPLAPLATIDSSGTLVQKTHGWHGACRRARGWGWHRHVRRGTVNCLPHARRRYRECWVNRRGVRVCTWRWR